MFTGRYPGQINIVDDAGLLKFASETLAERFAQGAIQRHCLLIQRFKYGTWFCPGDSMIDTDSRLMCLDGRFEGQEVTGWVSGGKC